MSYHNYQDLKYEIRRNSVVFTCTAVDYNEQFKNVEAASLMNDLLFELSESRTVFFSAYRLPNEKVTDIFQPTVIIEQAEVLLDPFHTFFHLSEAKVDVVNMFWAVGCTLYFFERDVRWVDFLASSEIGDSELRKLVKSGKLCAYFRMCDHGSEYFFESSKIYEKRLKRFFEDMARAGYEVC